jgi:starch phosphorylase
MKVSKLDLKYNIEEKLAKYFGTEIEQASVEQMYQATARAVMDILASMAHSSQNYTEDQHAKVVYYMSMEFLQGRSLRNNLFNLGIESMVAEILAGCGHDLQELYEFEPDAGIGNGGLGRLASCYLDAMSTLAYPAQGLSLLYEYGMFRQRIVDGEQVELPDDWLSQGFVWLIGKSDEAVEVRFSGTIEEKWVEDRMEVSHHDYTSVLAVPYDMLIPGYDSSVITPLRLWGSRPAKTLDMQKFARGEYMQAMEEQAMAEVITKVLYPDDNHFEGKSLRLKQQYFFVSASVQSIVRRHLSLFGTLSNLHEKVAIHINDTHPALVIPELMRILIDEHGYLWEDAFAIVSKTVAYTNHTVMAEALERWSEELFRQLLPRIHNIVVELNRRFCDDLWEIFPGQWEKISDLAIIAYGEVRMANLCVAGSFSVNGVSRLHSNILIRSVFKDYNKAFPGRFTNITNGIAHRRWLNESNPGLAALLTELIGKGFISDASELEKLLKYKDDNTVLQRLAEIKAENKQRLAELIQRKNGIAVNLDSIFDVQVKRLHEYKRQLLNVLHIIALMNHLRANPNVEISPRTFIFGAKAPQGYYMAKQIIKLIVALSREIEKDAALRDQIRVVFLEDYRVSLAEVIIPAAEVSEQISVAGKEASGTGNMKFMLNGALTLGTMDGANVEICEAVGHSNCFIFGMNVKEVNERTKRGYNPTEIYLHNPVVKGAIDIISTGIGGMRFEDVATSLLTDDRFMVLGDFSDYLAKQRSVGEAYKDLTRWNRMSLVNIANAGRFSADRSVKEYAENIWEIQPLEP